MFLAAISEKSLLPSVHAGFYTYDVAGSVSPMLVLAVQGHRMP